MASRAGELKEAASGTLATGPERGCTHSGRNRVDGAQAFAWRLFLISNLLSMLLPGSSNPPASCARNAKRSIIERCLISSASERPSYPESRLKWLHGMKNVGECRQGLRADLRGIRIIYIVIASVQQIEKLSGKVPAISDPVTCFCIQQRRRPRPVDAIRGKIARSKVTKPQAGREAL